MKMKMAIMMLDLPARPKTKSNRHVVQSFALLLSQLTSLVRIWVLLWVE